MVGEGALKAPVPGLDPANAAAGVPEDCAHRMLDMPHFVLIPQEKILLGGARSSWGQSPTLIYSETLKLFWKWRLFFSQAHLP